ncbi:hypothetical protein MCO_01777 [Bartonella sp. DB5-6]|nr:hypothetical protein MCO_01777 [Bartonella sp. DB5-6]
MIFIQPSIETTGIMPPPFLGSAYISFVKGNGLLNFLMHQTVCFT